MTDGTIIPIQQIPLQRIGKAREVAELANFLIEARYITGQVIFSVDRYIDLHYKHWKMKPSATDILHIKDIKKQDLNLTIDTFF